MTEADALNALLDKVGIFIWCPAPDPPNDPPSGITEIDFGESDVSDEDLAYLQFFPQLEWICLEDTSISDYGLTKLAEIVSLRHVEVQRTNVTEDGVTRLRKALPRCKIDC